MATVAALSVHTMLGGAHSPWLVQGVDLLDQLGAAALLLLVVSSPVIENALSARILVRYGAISYSLYLTHLVVLLTMAHLLAGKVPLTVIVAVFPVVAVLVAVAVYVCVEKPAIHAGRVLSARIDALLLKTGRPSAAAVAK